MTNVLEQAINCNEGDQAAKIIQDALGIETNDANYVFPKTWPKGSRATRPYHRRVAANRDALSGPMGMRGQLDGRARGGSGVARRVQTHRRDKISASSGWA